MADGNQVVVMGPSGTLAIQAISVGGSPTMEFRSGSFRGSADERRVIGVFMFIPAGGKEFELRFEFTDKDFAENDLNGKPRRSDPSKEVDPYTEPKQARRMEEGR